MTKTKSLPKIVIVGGLLLNGCTHKPLTSFLYLKSPELATQLNSFVAEKEAQAKAEKMPPEFRKFFALAAKGDWQAVSNEFAELRKQTVPQGHSSKADQHGRSPAWHSVVDTFGVLEAFAHSDEKYLEIFATNIIGSIPPRSIYFGGTDTGRFIISALQKSQVRAEPFFTLSQGTLPDLTYLDHLRGMYGAKIYIPTDEDWKKAFDDYKRDAAERRTKNQLKPGEDVSIGDDGEIHIKGQVALIQLKALLTKIIFDKNPNHQFYVEESAPLDWMYPYLEPHGLIFKINRQPLRELSDEMVKQDHDYWQQFMRPLIGDWLIDSTPVKEVAVFTKKTYAEQDFSGFTGDPRFIQNTYSQRMFCKLRSSLAGLYVWRMQQAIGDKERELMAREADFAFRQAWILCPDSPETVFRYVALLMDRKRIADALVVAETASQIASKLDQGSQRTFDLMVKEIRTAKRASLADGQRSR